LACVSAPTGPPPGRHRSIISGGQRRVDGQIQREAIDRAPLEHTPHAGIRADDRECGAAVLAPQRTAEQAQDLRAHTSHRAQIDHDTTTVAVEHAIDLPPQRDHHPRVELASHGDHPNLATVGRVNVIARAQSSREPPPRAAG
jgi:hypothetical protein